MLSLCLCLWRYDSGCQPAAFLGNNRVLVPVLKCSSLTRLSTPPFAHRLSKVCLQIKNNQDSAATKMIDSEKVFVWFLYRPCGFTFERVYSPGIRGVGSLHEYNGHLRYKWLNSVRPSESRPAGRARGLVRHRHRLKLNRHTHGHVASVPIDSQHVTTTHTPTARSFRSARLTAEHCADPSEVSPDLAAAQPARPATCRTLLGRAQGPCPLL